MARPVMLKDAIYHSALSLFGEHGFTETSIRDIARHAGVSEGSMYRHWPSKLALGCDIFKSNLEILAKRMRERLAGTTSLREQARTIISTFYELFDRDRNLFRFILLNQHDLWPRLGETSDHPVKVWEQFVASCWSGKNPTPHTLPLIRSMTLGMILQPTISVLHGSLESPTVQHVDPVVDQVCHILQIEN